MSRRRPAAVVRARRAMLKVKPIRPDEVNALNNKIREGCEKLGYSGFVTNHNREHCTQSGFCLLGCPFDAKQSMLITYIPAADRAGARIYANCPVRRIVAEAGRVRRVEGEVVDALGPAAPSLHGHARRSSCSAPARSTRRRCCCSSGIANAQRPRRPRPASASERAAVRRLRRGHLRLSRHSAELLRRRVHRPRAAIPTAATSSCRSTASR